MRTLLILALMATPAAAQSLRDTKPLDPPVFTAPPKAKPQDPPGIRPVPGARVVDGRIEYAPPPVRRPAPPRYRAPDPYGPNSVGDPLDDNYGRNPLGGSVDGPEEMRPDVDPGMDD